MMYKDITGKYKKISFFYPLNKGQQQNVFGGTMNTLLPYSRFYCLAEVTFFNNYSLTLVTYFQFPTFSGTKYFDELCACAARLRSQWDQNLDFD